MDTHQLPRSSRFGCAVVLSILAAGCGGGESESARVERTIVDFSKAVGAHDTDKQCALLSRGYLRTLASRYKVSCPALIRNSQQQLAPTGVPVKKVAVAGQHASAYMDASGTRTRFILVKENTAWKIDTIQTVDTTF